MRKFLCTLAFFSLSIAGGIAAEREAVTLDLAAAIELALSENPTIKIADLEVERYDYVRKTTMGALLPQLSVEGGYNHTLKTQDMARGFSFSSDQYNTLSATGTLSLALYSPTVYRTLKMNSSEAESAVESARSSRIELIAAVKNSFYGVLLTERTLEVLEENATTAKATVDETQIKFNHGLTSEYDLLTAQVQYSNILPLIVQSKASIANAKDLLKMYLSLPLDVEITAQGEFDNLKEEVISASQSMSHDISGNSSLRSLAISSEILSHQLRINNATRMPTLSAYGQLSYTGNDMESSFSLTGSSATSSENFFWQRPASVGLTLSIPIFNGLVKSNTSRQIQNQIDQLELQRQYAQESVSVNLSTAINNIHSAREQLFAQITTVGQATKAYEISDTRYTSGTGTILELNSARLAKTQAELSLSEAIYNLLTAKSEYNRIAGSESIK